MANNSGWCANPHQVRRVPRAGSRHGHVAPDPEQVWERVVRHTQQPTPTQPDFLAKILGY